MDSAMSDAISSTSSQAKGNTKRSVDEDAANSLDIKPPAKKPRCKKRSLKAVDSSIQLPIDALGLVMEFLSPRQLFNLAFSCKTLQARITTPLVVKSALIHGGLPKQSMTELYQLMSNKAMHAPSPLRLLRLVNGKRCEFCRKSRVNIVRPKLGVFACWNCTACRMTKPWKYSWARRNKGIYDSIFVHPQVVSSEYAKCAYMWAKPRTDAFGEPIGCLATFGDLDRMFEHTRKGSSLTTYIEQNLLATTDTDGAYQEFNDSYSNALARSTEIATERFHKKVANKKTRTENKVAKVEKMTEDLRLMLNEPFRDMLLKKHQMKYDAWAIGISKLPVVRFDIAYVDKLLRPYIITPSKLRKKLLAEIANTINEIFSPLAKFSTLDFLSDEDPFDMALKTHFGTKFHDLPGLLGMVTEIEDCHVEAKKMVDERFFDRMEKGQLISALARLVQNDLSCILSLKPEDSVVRMRPTLVGAETTLARTVWLDSLTKEQKDNDQRFRQAYAIAMKVLPQAKQRLKDYRVWLQEKRPENWDRRLRALEKAYSYASMLPPLLAENLKALDKKVSTIVDYY
ncbi:unnamed protein product [Cylindrotheca closterium]|uniref:F-box domain-containing protein n=1 Tax=Cylindrotheca closterium TaxID=2856 RepID=A0AAD2CJH5_9STRA|nr:unnamed protein product [Cylindrotheca closterium]